MRCRTLALLAIVPVGLMACGSDDTSDAPNSSSAAPTSAASTTSMAPTSTSTAPPATATPTTAGITTVAPGGSLDLPDGLVGRTWVLEGRITIGGVEQAPPQVHANLSVSADGTIAVNAGCNSGSTSVTSVDGDTLTLAPLVLTEKACADGDVTAWESTVVANLHGDSTWVVGGDTLTITPQRVSDTGLQLRDAATIPQPTTATTAPGTAAADVPDELTGATWIIDGTFTGGPVAEVSSELGASITFGKDGRIAVQTGCNSGTADATFADDGVITVGRVLLTKVACLDDAGNAAERSIVAALGERLTWVLDGDTLTLIPIDGDDLTGLRLHR